VNRPDIDIHRLSTEIIQEGIILIILAVCACFTGALKLRCFCQAQAFDSRDMNAESHHPAPSIKTET
jgi:hypothetical protein